MDATEIVREILAREGITGTSLSARLGKSYRYISNKLTQRNMHTNVFAQICDVLDYDVIVRSRYDGAEFYLSPREE